MLILRSWQRSRSLGISPDDDSVHELDFDESSHLVRAAEPVLDWLAAEITGTDVLVALADSNGTIIQRRFGNPSVIKNLGEDQHPPGVNVAEPLAGTNGIGLALAERRPTFVYGSEHFPLWGHTAVCMTYPLHNPLNGRVEGFLDFGFPVSGAMPAITTLLDRAPRAIEQRLLEQSSARERSLLQAYLETGPGLGAPGRADAPAECALDWQDRMRLTDKASEMIALGRGATTRTLLSDGSVTTLSSRPVTSPSGTTGMAVGVPASPPDTPDERLVLLGEPEVGKVAIAARRRLELLSEASFRIGTSLDITEIAEELATVAVPRFADVVLIDLADAVLRGDESPDPGAELRRTVAHGLRTGHPFYPLGARVTFGPTTPQSRCLASGQPELEPDLKAAVGWLSQDPERARAVLGHGFHSLITVPLAARGVVLGMACFYRSQGHAFTEDDSSLAGELAVRAALCIDNARRYTREHTMVLALQRRLLPHGLPEQDAVDVASRYLPATSGAGGDWFDVIPLSSARVALVAGDVAGRGLHAAATMGRLRTAIHNYSALDLAPDELLTQLDKLVGRLDQDDSATDGDSDRTGVGNICATCLYAVYDPTTQRCSLARAGHPPPALARPDGTVEYPDIPAGPPLGLGGFPFEATDIDLPQGSQLLLYTDGLINDRHRHVDTALNRIRHVLAPTDRALDDTCQAVLDTVPPDARRDDIALLLARTRALDPARIARWEVPADPAAVSDIRTAAAHTLDAWGLGDLACVTELLLSELVTNAIRYANGPIQVRLLHDRSLICEVSDTSSTSPHLRHAAATDEGGRGLFLVAQLAQEWGTRYTGNGKTIWAEQPLQPLTW
ncbi:SpoIIE family protein phosphatase [Streptomyces asiaticus]